MQKKIFITYTLLLIMALILAGSLTLSFVTVNFENSIHKKLIENAQLINNFILEKDAQKTDIDFITYAQEYGKLLGARVTFVNNMGAVVGDSAIRNLKNVENHSNRPEIRRALKGDISIVKRHSDTLNIDFIYIAVPAIENNKVVAVTRLALPLDDLKSFNYRLFRYNLIAALVGIFVSAIIGYKYANYITKPIKEITSIANKIANGDFNNRIYIKSKDEIGALANTLNLMAEKLDMTISEIQDKNTKLQSALTSMNEALVAVDRSYKIILINPVARSLFDIEEPNIYGKHVLEVIKNNKLHDTLKEILDNNIIGQKEITIDYPKYKILKIYTNFIKLDRDPNRIIGVMALIQDVTEVRKLENMRSDFVANVSHELKTPLTSIAGFIETLKNGAIKNEKVRDRFLDIIEIETERLTRLIEDLLSLSAIESGKLIYSKEQIMINETVEEINLMVGPLIKQKNLNYQTEVESALPPIVGNKDWFKQMIINLIDNAIKYTPEEGLIKLLVYKRYKNLFIVVKDTGIGIPKGDIPRLFERFYRVDKARSRKIGGTGLGLAIVKHIVLAFFGDIRVSSEVGKGTEFVLKIPLEHNIDDNTRK